MKKPMTLALFLAASTSPTAFAHEGHAHKVIATVVSVSADQIEVTNTERKRTSSPSCQEPSSKKTRPWQQAKDVSVN